MFLTWSVMLEMMPWVRLRTVKVELGPGQEGGACGSHLGGAQVAPCQAPAGHTGEVVAAQVARGVHPVGRPVESTPACPGP